MKILINVFMVNSDMESHLMKLRLCFQKCKEYRINFNPKKCAFMVLLRIDFKIHNFQRRKNTIPQEGSRYGEYANAYKPIANSSFK